VFFSAASAISAVTSFLSTALEYRFSHPPQRTLRAQRNRRTGVFLCGLCGNFFFEYGPGIPVQPSTAEDAESAEKTEEQVFFSAASAISAVTSFSSTASRLP
jgi:hypothetical protein